MKLIFGLFLFLAIVAYVIAGCEFKGKSLKEGESYTPEDECATYTCHSDGSVSGLACPVAASEPQAEDEN